jgi:anaerobic dimethyl sulfoxide reductase subunit C (anchor subunit)
MDTREWALVIFTILAQMSVGAFVILGIVHFFASREAGLEEADRLSTRALLAIGPTLALAGVASFFHLGNPINAPQAINNLATSWMSREIVLVIAFSGLGAVFAFMQWRKLASAAVRSTLAGVTAVVGLAMVYSMSQIYMLKTMPSWNSLATPLQFFVTTFLLGSLAVGAAFVANYAYVKRREPACAETQCSLLRSSVRWIALGSIVLLGIEMIAVPLQLAFLSASGVPQGAASVALMYNRYGVLLALRLAFAFVGAGIFALFLYRNSLTGGREQTLGALVYGAFTLVLAAEVLGRFIFYATHIKIGI